MFKTDKLTLNICSNSSKKTIKQRSSVIIVKLGQVLVHLETREIAVLGFHRFLSAEFSKQMEEANKFLNHDNFWKYSINDMPN